MLKINDKTFLNIQEAVQWLLDNNALPFQCTANYAANTEIGLGTIVNPTMAKVRIGSLIFFADSKVSTVTGVTSNGFIVSDQYNDLVDDVVYVSNVQINASGHLIVSLSNGTQIDAGLIKQIASFSINGSQHLIATYNDATTEDLGAIFSGNISISGNLSVSGAISGNIPTLTTSGTEITALKPVVEDMGAYSLRSKSALLANAYLGVVKNGNKVTFALSFELSLTAHPAYDIMAIAGFYIPDAVANKLVANSWAGLSNVINAGTISAISAPQDNGVSTNYYVQKSSDGGGFYAQFQLITTNLSLNTNYKIRIEQTYLLSTNLAE